MKNILTVAAVLAALLGSGPVLAAKPADNLAGAQKIDWNLSGEVMPTPPYGLSDILNSDSSSRLIVNQPNGHVAMLTGDMNGLKPNTTYTVYLSKPYTPYVFSGWNVAGSWNLSFSYLGTPYVHNATLTQTGSVLSGSGGYPSTGSHTYGWTITSGTVSGNTINFTASYTLGAVGTTMNVTGTIASDGSMSGTWSDNYGGARSGTWSSTSGQATKTSTGSGGWPGLYSSAIQPFTFTTDGTGSGDWHINLREADIAGSTLSVWVNGGGSTVLISDDITLR